MDNSQQIAPSHLLDILVLYSTYSITVLLILEEQQRTVVFALIVPEPAHKCVTVWAWGGETAIGCALTFASEAKFEIEAKISFRFEAKKSLISHDSLRCETPKI